MSLDLIDFTIFFSLFNKQKFMPKKDELPLDLTANCAGISSPNPFWLASAPPTNTGPQIMRAFEAGWGGAVWKTLGEPIQNVSGRYGAIKTRKNQIFGFNNIELITDRPFALNLREMREVKRRYPKHALIASLMLDSREQWHDAVKRAIDTGVDGIELNFSCPHGMCELGMGSVVGQDTRLNERITNWVKEVSTIPVLVKLTPNVTDIIPHGLAAQRGGADGVSLINTVKSIIGVDIDDFAIHPRVRNRSTQGGYCGPAIKPIALQMVASLARDYEFKLPISGIGGIASAHDAIEFLLLGASNVQVCTAVMLRGYRIIDEMIKHLKAYMRKHDFTKLDDFIGKAIPNFVDWADLDLQYKKVAKINENICNGCQICVTSCNDGGHQSIFLPADSHIPKVDPKTCVGCNLCQIVCPLPGAIRWSEQTDR